MHYSGSVENMTRYAIFSYTVRPILSGDFFTAAHEQIPYMLALADTVSEARDWVRKNLLLRRLDVSHWWGGNAEQGQVECWHEHPTFGPLRRVLSHWSCPFSSGYLIVPTELPGADYASKWPRGTVEDVTGPNICEEAKTFIRWMVQVAMQSHWTKIGNPPAPTLRHTPASRIADWLWYWKQGVLDWAPQNPILAVLLVIFLLGWPLLYCAACHAPRMIRERRS